VKQIDRRWPAEGAIIVNTKSTDAIERDATERAGDLIGIVSAEPRIHGTSPMASPTSATLMNTIAVVVRA
jgi:hypothetical protein